MAIKTNIKSKISIKPIEGLTLITAFLAIAISLLTLYFQFFYEKSELRASFISASFENDTTLISNVFYNNKGNQYATVLRNSVVFYQDVNDIENKSILFSKKHSSRTYEEEFDPIVLIPGQQIYREIIQPFDFRKINFIESQLNEKDTIRMALAVGYINNKGLYSTNYIQMGWLMLDTSLLVKYFDVEYKTELLKSDSYLSRKYRKSN